MKDTPAFHFGIFPNLYFWLFHRDFILECFGCFLPCEKLLPMQDLKIDFCVEWPPPQPAVRLEDDHVLEVPKGSTMVDGTKCRRTAA